MKNPQLKQPGQYGGDGLYHLMDGTKIIAFMHMSARDAIAGNLTRKRYGQPKRWWWSGKRK